MQIRTLSLSLQAMKSVNQVWRFETQPNYNYNLFYRLCIQHMNKYHWMIHLIIFIYDVLVRRTPFHVSSSPNWISVGLSHSQSIDNYRETFQIPSLKLI